MKMPEESGRENDTLLLCTIYTSICGVICFLRVENGEPVVEKIGSGLTVPVYVARTREPLRLSKGDVDQRFPDGLLNKVRIFFVRI